MRLYRQNKTKVLFLVTIRPCKSDGPESGLAAVNYWPEVRDPAWGLATRRHDQEKQFLTDTVHVKGPRYLITTISMHQHRDSTDLVGVEQAWRYVP